MHLIKMGGTISIDSEPGQTSRFEFTIDCELGTARLAPAARMPAEMRGAKALVVDGYAIGGKAATNHLSHWGCRVAEAGTGAEALRISKAAMSAGDAFLLVSIDEQMPSMSGTKLALDIRRPTELASLPLTSKRNPWCWIAG